MKAYFEIISRYILLWKSAAPLKALQRWVNKLENLQKQFRQAGFSQKNVRSDENLLAGPIPRWLAEVDIDVKNLLDERDAHFAQFIQKSLDIQAYLKSYPDVKAAGLNPIKHWLEYGMFEGRSLSTNTKFVIGENNVSLLRGHKWQCFTWRGNAVAVRICVMKQSLLSQIIAQGRHEPAVLASGALAIGNLRQFDASDLLDRDGVNFPSIFAAIDEPPKTILLIPFLCVGGAEKYAADLVDSLNSLGQGSVLVLVTEFDAAEAQGWESLKILEPFQKANVVFWRDICGPGHANPTVMARLLNVLRPDRVVVINSRLGLEVIAGFGRGLSQFTKLYCAYFSMGVHGLGAPFGTRYPIRTLPFAMAIADNSLMVNSLHRLWGELSGPGIEELPPKLRPVEDCIFTARLEARRLRAHKPPHSMRWLWVSRVEVFKGTAILAEIARNRPTDQFDIYGPIDGTLTELGLTCHNLRHCGILLDVSSADFTEYDGFLFTSLFEGMPNVVLEMSQHAIPMVLADVGGLRGTFDSASAQFVKSTESVEETATAFCHSMNHLASLTTDRLTAMVEAARDHVRMKHSPAAHQQNVAKLFSI